jgi:hypothetical protein
MKKLFLSIGFYWLGLVATAVLLYGLAAPNLILTSWDPYWQWQLWMWKTFFNNRLLLSQSYFLVCTLIMISYWWLLSTLWNAQTTLRKWLRDQPRQALILFLLVLSPLLMGMNGLSYDVFNYAFNAKMVVEYRENPHIKVALDFPEDPWVRFMHNTHTPAPYGYGWTALSLIPYLAGFGKLLPTWLLFKLASLLSLGLLAWWYVYAVKPKTGSEAWAIAVVLLNPLLLIEVLVNGHNDLWMMLPALASMWLIGAPGLQKKPLTIQTIAWSWLLLLLSISIKLATLAVVPIWLTLVVLNRLGDTKKLPALYHVLKDHILLYWPMWSAIALASLLLTERSKLFLPWYWSWVLVWLPLQPAGKMRTILQALFLGFSYSSLLRYLPYMLNGEYTLTVVSQQIGITFAGGVLFSCLWFIVSRHFFQPRRDSSHQVE